MVQDNEQAVLSFLRQEALAGHFESTTTEIANGVNHSYNQTVRVLERLTTKEQAGYRERGTERKLVRYFYLKDILDLLREKWQQY